MRIRAFFFELRFKFYQRSRTMGKARPMIMPEVTRTKYLSLVLKSSIKMEDKMRMERTMMI
jgi:hypothetical protein